MLITAAAALAVSVAAAPHAGGQPTPSVGIDTDATGNSATRVGAIQNCRAINVGDVIDVDVFVKDVQNLSGFQFNLNYNPAVLKVTKSSDQLFLASQQGSNAISISDPTPDSDGVYISAATEFGEIGTTDESGSGVLARITLEAVKAGSSPLTLTELILISVGPGGDPVPIAPSDPDSSFFLGLALNAAAAAGEPCQPPPSPTPGSAATPVTPAGGNGDGVVPGEGTPPADPGSSPGASDNATATAGPAGTPGTAGPEGTPGTAVPSTNGSDDDGGGLSTAAWIGIGVGVGATALSALAGGLWLARRRGRPQDTM